MSEWITDRRPTKDVPYGKVWISRCGCVMLTNWQNVADGEPWQPLTKPEPYVKPRRWTVREFGNTGNWYVVDARFPNEARGFALPTRQAAERIAAIYEEVMP